MSPPNFDRMKRIPISVWATVLAIVGRTDEAIAQFETALTVDPTTIPSRYRLANLLLQNGRSAAAAHHYEKIIPV